MKRLVSAGHHGGQLLKAVRVNQIQCFVSHHPPLNSLSLSISSAAADSNCVGRPASRPAPPSPQYRTLLNFHVACDDWLSAIRVFRAALEEDQQRGKLTASTNMGTPLIHLCLQHAKWDAAIAVFHMMVLSGSEPSQILTPTLLALKAARRGETERERLLSLARVTVPETHSVFQVALSDLSPEEEFDVASKRSTSIGFSLLQLRHLCNSDLRHTCYPDTLFRLCNNLVLSNDRSSAEDAGHDDPAALRSVTCPAAYLDAFCHSLDTVFLRKLHHYFKPDAQQTAIDLVGPRTIAQQEGTNGQERAHHGAVLDQFLASATQSSSTPFSTPTTSVPATDGGSNNPAESLPEGLALPYTVSKRSLALHRERLHRRFRGRQLLIPDAPSIANHLPLLLHHAQRFDLVVLPSVLLQLWLLSEGGSVKSRANVGVLLSLPSLSVLPVVDELVGRAYATASRTIAASSGSEKSVGEAVNNDASQRITEAGKFLAQCVSEGGHPPHVTIMTRDPGTRAAAQDAGLRVVR